MRTSDVLNRAADHIEQYGHRKFALGSAGQPTCALGAIEAVAGAGYLRPSATLMLYLGGSVSDWNNAPDRTASEVIEVLRACAVVEASRERESAQVVA